jgi:hypothetical protein
MNQSENGDALAVLRPIVRPIADGGFHNPLSYPSPPTDRNRVLACQWKHSVLLVPGWLRALTSCMKPAWP